MGVSILLIYIHFVTPQKYMENNAWAHRDMEFLFEY